MVSVAEAIQQTEKAEATALEREREIQRAESAARRIRVGGTVAEQIRFGPGLKAARKETRKQRERALAQVGTAREELSTFRVSIKERQQQIKDVQQEQARVAKFNADLAQAIKLARKGERGEKLVRGETKSVQRLFRDITAGRDVQRRADISVPEGFAGVSTPTGIGFVPIGGGEVVFPESRPSTTVGISTPSGAGIVRDGEIFVSQQSIEPQTLARFEFDTSVPETAQRPTGSTVFQQLPPPDIEEPRPEAPGRFGRFVGRVFGEARITEPRFFGPPRGKEVPPPLALGAIAGQEIAKGLSSKEFGGAVLPRTVISPFDIATPRISGAVSGLAPVAAGFAGRVAAEGVPKTPETVLAISALPFALGALPAAGQRIALGGLGGLETGVAAFQPGLSLEQRTAAGLGAGLAFTGAALVPTKFQLGLRGQRAQIESLREVGIITEKEAQSFLSGVELQRIFRRTRDVPVSEPATAAVPEIPLLQREVVTRGIAEPELVIFGSQARKLRAGSIRELLGDQPGVESLIARTGSDIDTAVANNRLLVRELQAQAIDVTFQGRPFAAVKGPGGFRLISRGGSELFLAKESLGFGGEKALDIKALSRVSEFSFAEKPVKLEDISQLTTLREQFSREISGGIGFGSTGGLPRKGGKDIFGAVVSGRALVAQARADIGTVPFLRLVRQRRVTKAERLLAEFEQVLPGVRKRSLQFDPTPAKGFELVPTTGTVTPRVGLADVGVDIGRLFPRGKRAQLGIAELIESRGGRIVTRTPPGFPRPRTPTRQRGVSQFDIAPVARPSVFRLPPVTASRFAPSAFAPSPRPVPSQFAPTITPGGRGFVPSAFDLTPRQPRRPFIPSEFRPTPPPGGFPGITPPSPPPITPRIFIEDPTRPRPRPKDGRRKLKRKGERTRKAPVQPVSVSFTAVATDQFGKFPKIRTKGLGLTPEQIRLQPIRRAPRRASLAGVRRRKR